MAHLLVLPHRNHCVDRPCRPVSATTKEIATCSRRTGNALRRFWLKESGDGGLNGRATRSEDCRFWYYSGLRLPAADRVGFFLMLLQIATASLALLFAATLSLSSHRFMDTRATSGGRVVGTAHPMPAWLTTRVALAPAEDGTFSLKR